MLKYLIVLLCLFSPIAGRANEPPPVPEGGFKVLLGATPCHDVETGEKGTCFVLQAIKDSEVYTVFFQDKDLMFIRQMNKDGSYDTIWVSDKYNSV